MLKYVLKRMVLMVLTLYIVATITFFMMHSIPGSPFNSLENVQPMVLAAIQEKYRMNDPTHVQYARYMGDLLQGDLGPSLKYQGMTVSELISRGLPTTAQLALYSILVIVSVSIPLGIYAALKNNKWQDGLTMALATIGVSVPSFIMATVLLYIFAMQLRWVPSIGLESGRAFILPVFALVAYSIAFLTRLTRSSLMDVMNQDYIRTARAKGLPESKVIWKHALRNALLPVVTVLGPLIAGLITGSFAIERIFAIPGIGGHFVDSIQNRDYPTIMGMTMFYCTLLVSMVFIVDLLYVVIDPRIKVDNS
ncbi:MAG: ABC transporter permease [Treponema sp.]|nr:ABC transporter permease [Treponema sp.]